MSLTHNEPGFHGLIGVAREDITPPVGIYARNWGAAEHDVAEGIHRPLTCTVLTLRPQLSTLHGQPSTCVLASLDLGWWRSVEDEWYVRGHLIDELSLEPASVMIALSHTHSGPGICREDREKPGGHLIGPYLERVREAAVSAARRAIETASPATITWSYGNCGLAQNRDMQDPNAARIATGFNPDGPAADDTLLVGRVTDDGGRNLAVLVNYACHPVTLAFQNRLISPDYIGAMREVIEDQTSGLCLFFQGASGELSPREHYTGDTAIADKNGRELGYAVLSTLEGMLPSATGLLYDGVVESGAPLAMWKRTPRDMSTELHAAMIEVELPVKDLPTVAEFDREIAACTDRVQTERLARQRRVRLNVGDGATSKQRVWLWRVGDGILVGCGNEPYSLLQTSLRSRFPGVPITVMNCVNGWGGYLPPVERYAHDIYQVWQTPFEQGSLEMLVEACELEVRKLLE